MPKETGESVSFSENPLNQERVLTFSQACELIKTLKDQGLRVIVAQGVFDLLHVGHLEYLCNAKKTGDVLFVGLENDHSVRLNKGETRPFNPLRERLEFMAAIRYVDYTFSYEDYPNYEQDEGIFIERYKALNPTSIAVSAYDGSLDMKRRQAEEAGTEIVIVKDVLRDSTTRLLGLLGWE